MPGPEIASAALLLRDDGQVLLVRHPASDAQFGGRWSLPMNLVGNEEVAEAALERLLREVLHVEPGPYEFAETVYMSGDSGAKYIVNVFTCVEWRGDPRYAERAYADAAWAPPAATGALEVDPDVRAWLFEAFVEGSEDGEPAGQRSDPADPAAIGVVLGQARAELLAAYEAIEPRFRERALDGSWSPLDVLAHAASVEAYYLGESLRLLTPGHTWRGFNSDQWEAEYRARPAERPAEVHGRLEDARAQTAAWLAEASPERLATFGNHLERGVVTVGDRIEKIARHDLEHVAHLRHMRETAQVAAGLESPTSDEPPARTGD